MQLYTAGIEAVGPKAMIGGVLNFNERDHLLEVLPVILTNFEIQSILPCIVHNIAG